MMNQKNSVISSDPVVESHPWQPFYPNDTRLLLLGSFPPPIKRWSIEFYYPNWQNDMWRILGLIFYNDLHRFEISGQKSFDKEKICNFLNEKRIGVSDMAKKVRRLQGNASDRFLEIVEPMNLVGELKKIPHCQTLVTAGQKSSETLASLITDITNSKTKMPEIGESVEFSLEGRTIHWYRMPSSSRAWPKPIAEKATIYRTMFDTLPDFL